MKEIDGIKYYSKAEIADMIGCTLATINARVSAGKIRGYYLGHKMHYTIEQVRQIAQYRRNSTSNL